MNNRKQILIVDDNDFMLHFIETIIKTDERYDVTKAKNGIEALHEISQNHFDLIISDILMPEMDGMELIRNLKAKNKDTPIIAISGGMEGEDGADYINYASYFADDVLKKPFTKSDLLVAIDLAANQQTVDLYSLFQ